MLTPSPQTAQYRLALHYLRKLRAANIAYQQGGESVPYALNSFDHDWAQINHWQMWVNQQNEGDDEAKNLCSAFPEAGADLLALRQEPRDRLIWLEPALAAARAIGDQHAEIQHLIALGEVYESLSTYEAATHHTQQALELAEQAEDRSSLPLILYRLAESTWGRGDYAAAQRLCEQCLSVSEELEDRQSIAQALGGMGIVALYQGDFETAQQFFEQALEKFRVLGNLPGVARYLYNLGGCNMEMGDFQRAQEYFEQSIVLYDAIGHKRGSASCQNVVGLNAVNLGLLDDAEKSLQRAYEAFLAIGHSRGVGDSLSNLGLVALQRKQYASAQDYFVRSLEIRREIGDQRGVSTSLGNVALVLMADENYQDALGYFEEATALNRELGNQFMLTTFLSHLAFVYFELNQVDQGREALHESLRLALDAGNPRLKLDALWSSIKLYQVMQRYAQATAWAALVVDHPAASQEIRDSIQALRLELEAALKPAEFAAAWEHGKTLNLDDVIPHILSKLTV